MIEITNFCFCFVFLFFFNFFFSWGKIAVASYPDKNILYRDSYVVMIFCLLYTDLKKDKHV